MLKTGKQDHEPNEPPYEPGEQGEPKQDVAPVTTQQHNLSISRGAVYQG